DLEHYGLCPIFLLARASLGVAAMDLMGGSGLLAMCVAGLVLGSSRFIHRTSVVSFIDGTSWLMQISIFLTLGLLAFPDEIIQVLASGLLIAAVLMFLARPISVFIGLLFSKLRVRAKMMIAWTGLRGAVPIIMAIYPLVAGLENADLI